MATETNYEQQTINAIKQNLHSICKNESKNTVEFWMTNCKLMSINYEDGSVKLLLNLPSTPIFPSKTDKLKNVEINDKNEIDKNKINISNTNMIKPLLSPKSPEDVDKENMMDKLTILKDHTYLIDDNDNNDNDDNDDDKKENITTRSRKQEKGSNGKSSPKTKKRSKSKTKKKSEKKRSSQIETKPKRPIETILLKDASNNKKKGLTNRRRQKHLRQRSKTTDDIDSFSIMAHDKWTYYSTELTASQQIRCQGFADIKCRYKMAVELKFGSKLKREDIMEFKVPLNTQRIYAYVVEDCLADGTNGEVLKVQGGTGKKYVRLFIKSQFDHGVHMKLHAWYK